MSGCHNTETLSLCAHGIPVKFGYCIDCESKQIKVIKIQELEKRISELEEICQGLFNNISFLERKTDNLIIKTNSTSPKPHKCPICIGTGKAMLNGTTHDYCEPCNSKGIVWG